MNENTSVPNDKLLHRGLTKFSECPCRVAWDRVVARTAAEPRRDRRSFLASIL